LTNLEPREGVEFWGGKGTKMSFSVEKLTLVICRLGRPAMAHRKTYRLPRKNLL